VSCPSAQIAPTPALLAVMHFYQLAQLRVMTGKVQAVPDAEGGDRTALPQTRYRLGEFPVAQLLAPAVPWLQLAISGAGRGVF